MARPASRCAWKWSGESGASLLILSVADLQPVLDRLKASENGVIKACDGIGIAVADPDGFPVLVVQRKGVENPRGWLAGTSSGCTLPTRSATMRC
jgi:hypothetical protein